MSQRSMKPEPGGEVLAAAVIGGLIRGTALSLEVFLHRRIGCRYLGDGWGGVLVMLGFVAGFPHAGPLPYWTAAYGAVWAVLSVRATVDLWRGRYGHHTRYTGRPHLARLLPRWPEERVKQAEGAAALALGFALRPLSRATGDYLVLAAAVVLLQQFMFVSNEQNRAMDLHDASAEQRRVAERFRRGQERR
jgi:hypothetical protein